MDNFTKSLIEELMLTLKIPQGNFNFGLIANEIKGLETSQLNDFYKEVMMPDNYGNGLKAVLEVAKKFKPAEVDILEGTHDKAKAMYDKFYAQQSAMTDYTQANRETIPNDREWFKNINYSKLKNRDGSLTYTKQEVYVLNELGGGEFLLDLPTKANSAEAIKLIKKTIDKAITTKYSDAKGIESKRVVKMLQGVA